MATTSILFDIVSEAMLTLLVSMSFTSAIRLSSCSRRRTLARLYFCAIARLRRLASGIHP